MTLHRYRKKYEDFPKPMRMGGLLMTDLNAADEWLLKRAKAGLGR
jgi:hypothetical protein